MLRKFTRTVSLAALATLLGLAANASRAADNGPTTTAAAGKASLVVTVVDGDGKPVAGAKVMLFQSAGGHKRKAAAAADGPTTAPATKLNPLSTETTDADGKATLSGLTDGTYTVRGRLKSVGNGHVDVTVADGKDGAVSLTLKAGKKKA